MPSPTLALSSLNGTLGFILTGGAFGDATGAKVASAGDINGDGYDDVLVTAAMADPGGRTDAGTAYIVFGKAGGFTNLSLAALDGTNGFRLDGAAAGDHAGFAGRPGDINGDGYDDLIIGANGADLGNNNSGGAYVIFGKAGGFAASMTLSNLDGIDGFRLVESQSLAFVGFSVSSAGDFNGDGYDEIIIGAPNRAFGGAAYVVYGKAGGFDASINLADLDGTDGFRVEGPNFEMAGVAVSAGGDVNGDGLDDLIVGAGASPHGRYSGSTYVVLGQAGGVGPVLYLSDIDGSNGFRLDGGAAYDYSGWAVDSAGDVNGDGYDDVIVGARFKDAHSSNVGAAYVFFGHAGGFGGSYYMPGLNGTDGFAIIGGVVSDELGRSVAGAGDIDGDGYDDIIVGAEKADPNGSNSGAAYVIYGKADGFSATINVSSLDGLNGFRLEGAGLTAYAGGGVSSAGDINGDGFDDVIIGARGAGQTGSSFTGMAYVVLGQLRTVVRAGTAGGDTYVGFTHGDQLSGGGGNDVLSGLAGDDLLDGGDLSDRLYGGDGLDTLTGGSGGDLMYGEDGADNLDGDADGDKLFGGAGADTLLGGLGNDRLEGGDGADILTGGDGNDYLDGGATFDMLYGGLGNDVYIIAPINYSEFSDHDAVIETADAGYDIVRSLRSWTLDANVEALELMGVENILGSGNELANNIKGNIAPNTLSGKDGADTLDGGDGDDLIVGGRGSDRLYGGAGADSFSVRAENFGQPTVELDHILDFSTAEGDRITLNTIDAIPGGANDAFRYVGATFTKHAGEMTLSFAAGVTLLRLDITGDGKADYQMKINGDVTGDWGRWLL
ncbi:MAG: hypothetical protein K0R83_75 [Caulobacter sp.]|jgi:Ca2+-binding RTX toxin-like protein|nr:hypothetical protein [Caulobacter sp.]